MLSGDSAAQLNRSLLSFTLYLELYAQCNTQILAVFPILYYNHLCKLIFFHSHGFYAHKEIYKIKILLFTFLFEFQI